MNTTSDKKIDKLMKKSLENLLAKQGIALLNTLSREERRARTETIKAR